MTVDNNLASVSFSASRCRFSSNTAQGASIAIGHCHVYQHHQTDMEFLTNGGDGCALSLQPLGGQILVHSDHSVCTKNAGSGFTVDTTGPVDSIVEWSGGDCDDNDANGIRVIAPAGATTGRVSLTDCSASGNGLQGTKIIHRDTSWPGRTPVNLVCDLTDELGRAVRELVIHAGRRHVDLRSFNARSPDLLQPFLINLLESDGAHCIAMQSDRPLVRLGLAESQAKIRPRVGNDFLPTCPQTRRDDAVPSGLDSADEIARGDLNRL